MAGGHGEGHQRTTAAILKSMGKECFTQTISSFKSYEARRHALNWQHFLAAGPRWSDDMPTYIYREREPVLTYIQWCWMTSQAKELKPLMAMRHLIPTADWTCPKENNELQTYWSIFNAAGSKLLYTIYIIYVCQCGDLRRCKTCAEMLLLQSLASSLVESSEFSAFRCSPELRALELQNLLVASSCMPQTSPRKKHRNNLCRLMPAHLSQHIMRRAQRLCVSSTNNQRVPHFAGWAQSGWGCRRYDVKTCQNTHTKKKHGCIWNS